MDKGDHATLEYGTKDSYYESALPRFTSCGSIEDDGVGNALTYSGSLKRSISKLRETLI